MMQTRSLCVLTMEVSIPQQFSSSWGASPRSHKKALARMKLAELTPSCFTSDIIGFSTWVPLGGFTTPYSCSSKWG